jgi:hypothetical protein
MTSDRLSSTTCPWNVFETFSNRRMGSDAARIIEKPGTQLLLSCRRQNAGVAAASLSHPR